MEHICPVLFDEAVDVQKLVSLSGGLGLVEVEAGLSGLCGVAVAEEAGEGAWPGGEVGVALRCGGDVTDCVAREWRFPGEGKEAGGVLRPNLTSDSLQTARLRLTGSGPAPSLASSWQRSTKRSGRGLGLGLGRD